MKGGEIGDEVRKRLSVQMMMIGRLTKTIKDDSKKIVSIEKSKNILADNVKATGEELAEANAYSKKMKEKRDLAEDKPEKNQIKSRDLKNQLKEKNNRNAGLERENGLLQLEIVELEAKLDNLMKDQKVETQICVNDLFERTRKSTKGGASQYNTELVKIILEMIATGAAPSEIESLVIIFARTIELDDKIESLPRLRYIQNLRVVLHTLGEAIGVIQLS